MQIIHKYLLYFVLNTFDVFLFKKKNEVII